MQGATSHRKGSKTVSQMKGNFIRLMLKYGSHVQELF